MPIWGTCLGMQHMLKYIGGQNAISSHPDIKKNKRLKFFVNPLLSKIFKDLAADALIFENHAMTYNYHNYGIGVGDFNGNAAISAFYNIITTNVDENGIEYVSVMEAKNYPFYGV